MLYILQHEWILSSHKNVQLSDILRDVLTLTHTWGSIEVLSDTIFMFYVFDSFMLVTQHDFEDFINTLTDRTKKESQDIDNLPGHCSIVIIAQWWMYLTT